MAVASSSRTENPFLAISELPPSHQSPGESSRTAQPQQNELQPYQRWPQSYGQPVTPYRPSRNQEDEQQLRTPRRIRAWNNAKIGLRIANITICFAALAITFSFPLKSRAGHINMSTSPVLFVALIWDAAELVYQYTKGFRAGLHPAAHVTLSLLIMLGAAISFGLKARLVGVTDDGEDCWKGKNHSGDHALCEGRFAARMPRYFTVTAMTFLVWLFHFILFLRACIDTARRNVRRAADADEEATPRSREGSRWPRFFKGRQSQEQEQEQEQGQEVVMQRSNTGRNRALSTITEETRSRARSSVPLPTYDVMEYYAPKR